MLPGFVPTYTINRVAPVVQGTTQGDTGVSPATSTTVTLPSSVAANDLLVIIGNTSASGVVPSTPAGWTALTFGTISGSGEAVIFYKQAAGGETSVVVSHSSARFAWLAYRISGWDTTKAPEVGTPATGSSTTPDPPSVTPSWALTRKNLYLATCGVNNGNTGSTSAIPSGYTNGINQRTQKNDSTDCRISAAQKAMTVTATSEDPGTFTTTTGAWRAQTIAIAGL